MGGIRSKNYEDENRIQNLSQLKTIKFFVNYGAYKEAFDISDSMASNNDEWVGMESKDSIVT